MSMDILIRVPNKDLPDVEIQARWNWTTLHLKTKVQEIHPLKPLIAEQRLIHGGKTLLDGSLLKDYIPQTKDSCKPIVYLVVRTPPRENVSTTFVNFSETYASSSALEDSIKPSQKLVQSSSSALKLIEDNVNNFKLGEDSAFIDKLPPEMLNALENLLQSAMVDYLKHAEGDAVNSGTGMVLNYAESGSNAGGLVDNTSPPPFNNRPEVPEYNDGEDYLDRPQQESQFVLLFKWAFFVLVFSQGASRRKFWFLLFFSLIGFLYQTNRINFLAFNNNNIANDPNRNDNHESNAAPTNAGSSSDTAKVVRSTHLTNLSKILSDIESFVVNFFICLLPSRMPNEFDNVPENMF